MSMVEIKELCKTYAGKISYEALSHINVSLAEGEFVGIMGPSGSGKTTLMNMIATIDAPTSGEVLIHGSNPFHLSPEKLAIFRRRELGFVFQSFNLLGTLTVKENIVLPLTLDGVNVEELTRRAETVAEKLGITTILHKRTYEISGGQAQRAAIARAIIHRPKLLLADEPTGNLDSKASRDVMETMSKLNKEDGTTMMLVTHDAMAASYCDRVVFIKDGRLQHEISRRDKQHIFMRNIMDVLSVLGGNRDDLFTVGLS
ncbi:ABC transporter ATP-binding protein [Paenibacillus apiarius]|uniref:ABC transporter ATP-binding protein n=1 Tax=Paenibacillus apiarius TaxID=46240 RepID=A0ABT4DS04_9BACL|nr:ABC transporter ATP-binding protein [Paenibacillus apiarius]MCY9514288.1 ABC transporter ATP-binding protein [Paenibacillus apiarius]MCY9520129.1 ABC transporter ATP-binding protein [Paenibacillus apiarius]MCY9550136.1 ABC transporter ATP-binding protein [Paenibacillus apiarius]MCY9560253.1 ABC transporter ATP-binding protein [Paenibacillus apiarius]MCY9683151.1 ABC transporter ATP-binding protein [Paenibacillus apiarius]